MVLDFLVQINESEKLFDDSSVQTSVFWIVIRNRNKKTNQVDRNTCFFVNLCPLGCTSVPAHNATIKRFLSVSRTGGSHQHGKIAINRAVHLMLLQSCQAQLMITKQQVSQSHQVNHERAVKFRVTSDTNHILTASSGKFSKFTHPVAVFFRSLPPLCSLILFLSILIG